jgi:hypothetical protein
MFICGAVAWAWRQTQRRGHRSQCHPSLDGEAGHAAVGRERQAESEVTERTRTDRAPVPGRSERCHSRDRRVLIGGLAAAGAFGADRPTARPRADCEEASRRLQPGGPSRTTRGEGARRRRRGGRSARRRSGRRRTRDGARGRRGRRRSGRRRSCGPRSAKGNGGPGRRRSARSRRARPPRRRLSASGCVLGRSDAPAQSARPARYWSAHSVVDRARAITLDRWPAHCGGTGADAHGKGPLAGDPLLFLHTTTTTSSFSTTTTTTSLHQHLLHYLHNHLFLLHHHDLLLFLLLLLLVRVAEGLRVW